ncbi:uncharacterized protein LOC119634228 [Glossina fuscipes]|uniref:Uncharacterized protein LOC119634228 n=1 Tax=Glossina fuscipes TaxID=7396 RepID=A0A8U0WEY9_9MUSC|nr:uncharacterized protein LOC119634228 [Glossina fuscipes]
MNRWSKSCFTLLIILFSFTIFVTNLQIKGKASHLKKATGAKGVKLKSSIHEILKSSSRQYPAAFPGSSLLGVCPLCDSSVFGYCSHKLIHDTCCCTFPVAIYRKPPQCVYYDCRILYAKSCYEHNLIKNCCCQNPHLSFN